MNLAQTSERFYVAPQTPESFYKQEDKDGVSLVNDLLYQAKHPELYVKAIGTLILNLDQGEL